MAVITFRYHYSLQLEFPLEEVNQQTVWRLKLLRSGERVKVFVDAKAGKILEAKAEIAAPKPYRDINSASTTITLSDNH